MNFKKCKKGEYGYIAYKKTYEAIYFSILAVIIITLLVVGIVLNHTRNNLFTVFAVLIVLPAAKVFVNLLMLMKFKTTSGNEYETLKELENNNIILYDMPIATPDCIIYAPIILIREKEVFLYVNNKLKAPDKCEKYIKNFARNDAININVKIVTKDIMLSLLRNGKKTENDVSGVINIFTILHI